LKEKNEYGIVIDIEMKYRNYAKLGIEEGNGLEMRTWEREG